MKITNMPIDSIIPYAHNAKEHPEWQIDQIVKSIQEFGFNDPIAVDESGVIIEGHGRYFAAIKLGMEEIPVIILSHMTDEQKKAYILAHNKLTMNTGFNTEILDLELGDISGIDMSDFGFDLGIDDVEVNGLTDPDDIPEEAPPVCKPGQVWQLGKHRLMCGDATKQDDVERLMNGKKADMVFTDPPYGMNLNTDFSNAIGSLNSIGRKNKTRGNKYESVIGDDKDFNPTPFLELFNYIKEQFWFGADYYAERINDKNKGSWLVWDKRKDSQADAFGSEFELIWSKNKHKRRMLRHDWFGFLSSQNAKDAQNRLHPTQKPTSLIIDIVKQWGRDCEILIDFFGGSGSTLIACEQLNRTCYMMEIDPHYCDVIIKRWEQFTGNKASLLLD